MIKKHLDFDPVRPGEQWFFYWKTSAALWESRILEFATHEVVFLPVYWGFHAENQNDWDFGKIQPEKDLLRLTQLLTQHGRKFCFILPLTPAPFLPNGGVPVYAARTLSQNQEGIHLAVLDQENILHKMFSFFEPKVFQSFVSFCQAFGTFLSKNKIKAPIWGGKFFYYQFGRKISFIEDSSITFEQGFSRYLKQNNTGGVNLTIPHEEYVLKSKFTDEVDGLFSSSAESTLAPYWSGTQRIVMLGSSPEETIVRSLPGGKSQLEFTRDLFHHFISSDWISSALLTSQEKKETLDWILKEHFGSREIDERYHYKTHKGELTSEFKPFGVIDLFESGKDSHFSQIGLYPFLSQHFRWLYQSHGQLNFTPEWIDESQHKIKIFYGKELDRIQFAQILKLFMMGQRVLLDRAGLGDGLDKKLQVFLIENNIKSQSVNFMTLTQIHELGEGRLVVYDGETLKNNPGREKFWLNLFNFMELVQPEIQMDEDVFSLWRIRGTTPHELSYLDVRRVNLYNPTSYKKTISIKTHKHFAFMKMIDPTRAQAKSTPDGVDVEILPQGKIALDFGHYEEKL